MKFDLKHFDYHLLKNLSEEDEAVLAEEIRKEIIADVSHNGGHLSSNLGVVDLTISLLTVFDPSKDDILFDVGHQAYTYKILTGRDLSLLRKKEGVSGFQKIDESPYDKYESGHSGSSISVALGMAAAKKLAGEDSYTVVVIGDASIANGEAFEALNSLDEKMYGKLIIVINDNNMSISKPQGAVSKFMNKIRTSVFYQRGAGKFKAIFDKKGFRWIYRAGVKVKDVIKRTLTQPNFFDSFNGAYLGPIDGHDFHKMQKFLYRAKNIDRSVILHVRTKKGKGYKLAEEDESGYWHGTSAFDPETGLPMDAHLDKVSFSHLAGLAIKDKMEADPKCILITPAMKVGSHLEESFKEFPDRCFDAGIAEEHAIDLAAGFALKGFHPILSIYSTFMQRGYDQLLNDICRMKLKVLVVVERAGLIGQDGSSHQGIFDVSMVLSMPNSTVLSPYSGNRLVSDIQHYDFTGEGPTFIRVERDFQLKSEIDEKEYCAYKLLKADNPSPLAFVLVGKEGRLTCSSFKGKADVVLLNEIKPLGEELIRYLAQKKKVVLYDPTGVESGLSAYLVSLLEKSGFKGQYLSYSLPVSFIAHATKGEQLKELHLDCDSFVSAGLDLISKEGK